MAFVGAHLLRFEGHIPEAGAARVAEALPVVVAVKMAVLYVRGVYRGTWRYAGIPDLIHLGASISVGSLAAAGGLLAWTGLAGLSRAALVLDWMLSLGLLAAARLAFRAIGEYLALHRDRGSRVLIAGTGPAGVRLARALREMPDLGYVPAGFVAHDGRAGSGAVIQGLPVLGTTADLPALLRRHRIEAVIMVPADLDGAEESIRRACNEAGVGVRRMGPLIERPPPRAGRRPRRALARGAPQRGGGVAQVLVRQVWPRRPIVSSGARGTAKGENPMSSGRFVFVAMLAVALAAAACGSAGRTGLTGGARVQSDPSACTTIREGLTDSSGTPLVLGFDQFGYNYQAHQFNGIYDGSDRAFGNQTDDFADDRLLMEWSDDWLSNMDCTGDDKLDRGASGTSQGWLTNSWEGEYTDASGVVRHYTYFVKIVWVGPCAGTPGCIWNEYRIVQEVYNEPGAMFHAKITAPGLGLNDQWTQGP